jgi:hypothetical protein
MTTPSQSHAIAPQSPASPAATCKNTQRLRTHSRAHSIRQCPQLGQVDQACSNSRRTRVIHFVVGKAARMQKHAQQHDRERMLLPRVPMQALTTALHTWSGTQRASASAAGAGGPGLHQWPPRLRHRCGRSQGCINTNRTHNDKTANACHRPVFPCKHSPPPCTHGWAQNVRQCLQLGHAGQSCTDGCRTRVTNIVVEDPARPQTTRTTTRPRTQLIAPRSHAST